MNIWIVLTFWFLWIMLLWTLVYKDLFESLLSVLSGIHVRVELLDHMAILSLTLWGTRKLFSTVIASLYIPTNNAQKFQFFHILANIWYLLFSIVLCLLLNNSHPSGYEVIHFSHVRLFPTPGAAASQAFPSITNSWSVLRLMSIESVMPSNHLILCCPFLLLPSIFSSIRVFSKESVLCIRWPKYLELQHQSF